MRSGPGPRSYVGFWQVFLGRGGGGGAGDGGGGGGGVVLGVGPHAFGSTSFESVVVFPRRESFRCCLKWSIPNSINLGNAACFD